MTIKIKNDIFNISNRIKKINKNYNLFFNKSTDCYEIWDNKNFLICTLPFKNLDCRNLDYLRMQLSKNNKEILDDIENFNSIKQKEINEEIKEKALSRAENILRGVKNESN